MRTHLLCPSLALLAAGLLPAAETPFIGPRATGMGGATVASANDLTAQYANPAVFGFMGLAEDDVDDPDSDRLASKAFGVNLIDFQFGIALTGNMGPLLEDLSNIDYTGIGSLDAGNVTADDVSSIIQAFNIMAQVDDPGNAIFIDANAGAGARFGNMAIGARAFGQAAGYVDQLDLTNLGIDLPDITALNTEFANAASGDVNYVAGTGSVLNASQAADLAGAGLDAGAIDYIDFKLTEAQNSGLVDSSALQQTIDLLVGLAGATDGVITNDFDNNTTSVVMRAMSIVEIPFSYGYALTPQIAVGATAKLMFGRLYNTRVLVFAADNTEVIDAIDENYESSTTIGFDLSALARFDMLNLGVVLRNINRPTFDGFDDAGFAVDDGVVDSQITIGAAWMPTPTLTLEANIDLLEAGTVIGSLETQNIAIGAEWDVASTVALRGGIHQNIAIEDTDPVLSAGIGFDLFAARIDFAGAIGLGTVEYDGSDWPTEARAALGIQIDF